MMSQLMAQPRQMSVSLVVRRANSLTQKELRCPLQAVTYSASDPSSYESPALLLHPARKNERTSSTTTANVTQRGASDLLTLPHRGTAAARTEVSPSRCQAAIRLTT